MVKTMNPDVKQQWLAALRSGEYKQGQGRLRSTDNHFCCLGVLCDLWVKGPEGGALWSQSPLDPTSYELLACRGLPPLQVLVWAGLESGETLVYKEVRAPIYTLNDDDPGLTFAQIADLIEEQL